MPVQTLIVTAGVGLLQQEAKQLASFALATPLGYPRASNTAQHPLMA